MPARNKRKKKPKKKDKKPNRGDCEERGGKVECEHDFDDKVACVRWNVCYCVGGDYYGEWEESEPLPNCSPSY